MFNGNRIKKLEERVAILENPYKFNIGERVTFKWPLNSTLKVASKKGMIVDRRFDYNLKYARGRNEYFIYYKPLKHSYWVLESCIDTPSK